VTDLTPIERRELDLLATEATSMIRERITSLENDVRRCFVPILGGPDLAPFPAVMYAMATLDYLSSCFEGWNDTRGSDGNVVAGRNQTNRMVKYLVHYCHYDDLTARLGVTIGRHKLMHTGEPRRLRRDGQEQLIDWGIVSGAPRGLTALGAMDGVVTSVLIDPSRLAEEFRDATFREGGYLSCLRRSIDLAHKFDAFRIEIRSSRFIERRAGA
jgi:hypothetical protein